MTHSKLTQLIDEMAFRLSLMRKELDHTCRLYDEIKAETHPDGERRKGYAGPDAVKAGYVAR